MRRQAIKTDY